MGRHMDEEYRFSAPGRVEIGGNHTDHQHGRVLAAAINLESMLMCGKVTHNNLIGSSSPIPSARYSYF